MSTSSALSSLSAEQLKDFARKYQIVLSSCRLLTEAQSALDRSIVEFVSVAENLDPGLALAQPNAAPTSSKAQLTQAPEPVVDEDSASDVAPTTTKPAKKEKKVRDPDQPRRPGSAYLLFQNAVRNDIKAAMPDEAKGPDVQKAVTEKWKNLTDTERKPYLDQYDREVKTFEGKMATYNKEKGIVPKAKATPAANKSTPKKSNDAPAPATLASPTADDAAAAASLVVPGEAETDGEPAAVEKPKASKKRNRKSEAETPSKKDKTPAKSVEKPAAEEKKDKKKRKKSVTASSDA